MDGDVLLATVYPALIIALKLYAGCIAFCLAWFTADVAVPCFLEIYRERQRKADD